MAKLALKRATTSKLIRLFIQDSSQSDGRGLTGLTNASGGLVAYQIREGQSSATAITLSAGTVGTWSSGGFKEVDATNLPGVYELGIPDVALSTGNSVIIMLKGATNMVPVICEIEIDAYDPQDATRLGLTALPNAAAGANGGLPTGDASGRVTVGSLAAAAIQSIWDALMSALTTGGSVGKLLADNLNATVGSRLATAGYTAPDNATIATRASQASVDAVAGAVDTEVAAILAAVDTEVAAIKAKTDALPSSPANEATLTTIAGYVDTEVAAIKAKTDLIPDSPAAVGSAMTLDLTQAVPTSNTAQTLGDALNAARAQGFGKWVMTGTSLVLYASDGTTVVRTFVLDSATSPTSRI